MKITSEIKKKQH